MNQKMHVVLEERDSQWVLRAPLIGRVTLSVVGDSLVVPGSVIGTLDQLHDRYALVVPDDAPLMRVVGVESGFHQASVAYGGAILTCEVVEGGEGASSYGSAADTHADFAFKSPMAGQFYLRPSPDEPHFVEVGQVVEPGDQIGLVEVMKFFYPLALEASAGRYKLLEFQAADASSIEAGSVIALFERLDPS